MHTPGRGGRPPPAPAASRGAGQPRRGARGAPGGRPRGRPPPGGGGGPTRPRPLAEGRVNPGLGPEAKPLSSGPGYKGSPSWSPGGDRVAFIVDGYVVDRTVDGERHTRWTTKDFVAAEAEWTADGTLNVLGGGGAIEGKPGAVYRTDPEQEGSLGVEEIAGGVLAMTPGPERKDVVLILE